MREERDIHLFHAEHVHLARQWAETRSQWRDAVALSFERECWQPIDEHASAVHKAAERLCNTLDAALERTS
jgi:hypothetical protein